MKLENSIKPGIEYFTVMAAAKYLGVSREKIVRMAKAGMLEIAVNPLDTRQRLIPRTQLDEIKAAITDARIITDLSELEATTSSN